MNLTDVGHLTDDGDHGEDKMEKWAKRENMTVRELAEMYTQKFLEAVEALDIGPYDVLPKATDHIQEQIDMIVTLEQKGFVYRIDNDGMYMNTSKVEDYGKLARLDSQDLQAWARVDASNKKNPSDFALRKFSAEGECRQMERDSPRWVWFPWRHIECSAMASKYLGEEFDIHTWWVDHIGVHHTNEIAQSECCFGSKPRVHYRLHNEFLQLWGKKMSKSAWAITTVAWVVESWFDAMDIKYLFLSWHYRSFLDFGTDMLEQSRNARTNLYKKIHSHPEMQTFQKSISQTKNNTDSLVSKSYASMFESLQDQQIRQLCQECAEVLCDDMNTPKLLALYHTLSKMDHVDVLSVLYWFDSYITRMWLFEVSEQEAKVIPQEIHDLAQQRVDAKKQKDYARADKLRQDIEDAWFSVQDTSDWYLLS